MCFSANVARNAGAKMSPGVQPGTIGTISGYGAYANLATTPQQVIIPQFAGGQAQYAAGTYFFVSSLEV